MRKNARSLEKNRSTVVVSEGGVIHSLDEAFCLRYGYSEWDLVGAHFSEIAVFGKEFNSNMITEMFQKRYMMQLKHINGKTLIAVGTACKSLEAKNLRLLYLYPLTKKASEAATILRFNSQIN